MRAMKQQQQQLAGSAACLWWCGAVVVVAAALVVVASVAVASVVVPSAVVRRVGQNQASVDYLVSTGEFSKALSFVVHGGGDVDISGVQVDLVDDDDDTGGTTSGSGCCGETTVVEEIGGVYYNVDENGVVCAPYVHAAVIELDNNRNAAAAGTGGGRHKQSGGGGSIVSVDKVRSSGFGATGDDGRYYLCCDESAIRANACDGGHLLGSREGEPIYPFSSNSNIQLRSFRVGESNSLGATFRETSRVAVLFANCQQQPHNNRSSPDDADANDEASSSSSSSSQTQTTLRVHGTVSWTSYVTVGMVPFFATVTLIHLRLCLWYRRLMVRNESTRIDVENWIFVTLVIAAVASFVETTILISEVFESNEIMAFKIASMFLSLARQSATRCLYLVLSLGLGVAVDSLPWITVFLVATFLAVEVFLLWAMNVLPHMHNTNFYIPVSYSTFLWTELVFACWIPIALLVTIWRLWKKRDRAKLFRYKIFLGIYAFTATLTLAEKGILGIYYGLYLDFAGVTYRGANDVLYLFPLACVAVLWRPNPDQRKYSHAYVLLEDGAGEEDTNDLELTEYNNENDKDGRNDDDDEIIENQIRVV